MRCSKYSCGGEALASVFKEIYIIYDECDIIHMCARRAQYQKRNGE